MPSETFFCPHCHRQLTKSAQAYVLGELTDNRKSSFIALGSQPEAVRCPGCGKEIDAQKMVAGDYDGTGTGTLGCLEWVVGAAIFVVTVQGMGWSWWIGVIFAFVAAGAVISIRDRMKKGKSR